MLNRGWTQDVQKSRAEKLIFRTWINKVVVSFVAVLLPIIALSLAAAPAAMVVMVVVVAVEPLEAFPLVAVVLFSGRCSFLCRAENWLPTTRYGLPAVTYSASVLPFPDTCA
jgi:hypothetical protein